MMRRRRPVWVYLVVLVYLLLVAAIVDLPLVLLVFGGETGPIEAAVVFSGIVFLLGASLLFIPVRTQLQRPVRRRSIALPLIVSAVCAALVFGAGGLATLEYLEGSGSSPEMEVANWLVVVGTGLVWLGWMVLFGWLSRSVSPQTINDRMYQLLLAGSVLELLVALPMHLVVRRRTECCAGLATGLGIGVGLFVMLIALGPAVFFLFYRRYHQAYADRRPPSD
ncbi:MAG TPA: hypothetical protein VHR66_24685 [Gemmataceae bacterium]|jgi:hypothetical protein|nr:hypothetical protein [Gemmataceae bacterium]